MEVDLLAEYRWFKNLINGSGYPNGLKGEKILLEAKTIAVADVADTCLRLFNEKGVKFTQ